ncbi:helix-turn-helix transcriptional regulator [Pigmentiphaga sp.]|uniref:helix-turn-helix transcriptional regulator n=1 Tax=Pigmentiphaga sp. TaxID=1977564 RepID=UPI00128B91F4|nr:helix-turn-helix transcriptional regulator [Pigmentiphaga sp.]MPS27365.1 helix-turn-helix transcriptional regulator [Alcaligenaceae bacterium SAGV5]MPS50574.1 helix-turn-helix transcriptional regulator [Alcaligenaceae bacterium SAGV3]MPT59687.1 helix-turn-helix transcriptional regulator [Alcaligenaceae bacterium]
MGITPSQEIYDALVGLCYESVLDNTRWPALLDALAAASGRQFGAIAIHRPGETAATVTLAARCDPAAIQAYNAHYGAIDPIRELIAATNDGQWTHDRRELPAETLQHHPYYQEFQQAQGMDDRASIRLDGQDSCVYVALLTAIGVRPDASHDDLLVRLAPHLQRAGTLYDTLAGLRDGLGRRDRLLDSLPTPLWLLDDGRRVAYRNAAAERHAARPDGALCEHDGQIRPRRAPASRLETAILQAAGHAGPRRAARIAPPTAGGPDILVTPLSEDHPDNPLQRPLVAVSVIDPEQQNLKVTDLFQFSRAEARLAAKLQEGLSLSEYAERQGIALSTARTQLRALFTKTGTHRQGELVSLLLRLTRH